MQPQFHLFLTLSSFLSGEWHEIPEYCLARKLCEEMNFKTRSTQSVVEVIDLDKEIAAQAIEVTGDAEITWDLTSR